MKKNLLIGLGLVVALGGGAAAAWFTAMSSVGQRVSGMETRLLDLANEQLKRETQLSETNEKIATTRAELEHMRAQLAFHQCEARVASLQAAAKVAFAECASAFAAFARCEAVNEAKKSKRSLWGTFAGLGLATLTGGASLLAAGTGAVVGGSTSNDQDCGDVPQCKEEPEHLSAVLADEGLLSLPVCTPPAPLEVGALK